MAKTTFEKGDTFNSSEGTGIVLSANKALIITGQGGRTGYGHVKLPIPKDAVPGKSDRFEVQFALKTAALAIKEVETSS